MTRRLVVAALLWTAALMCGCAMSNDEVIREVKKCGDAGMAVKTTPSNTAGIHSVVCMPKEPVQ